MDMYCLCYRNIIIHVKDDSIIYENFHHTDGVSVCFVIPDGNYIKSNASLTYLLYWLFFKLILHSIKG